MCTVENVHAPRTAAAHEEVAAVRPKLAAKVAEKSLNLAHKPADNPLRTHRLSRQSPE
jgi:hypothetical protein